MKKTLIAASLFLAASSSTLTNALTVVDFGANAQLAFVNTQLAVANGLLVSIRGGVSGTVQQIQGVRAGQEASIKQVDQYQEDTDKRNRLREGLSETLRRDLDALPTIEQCVEMTNRSGNSGAVRASSGGGGAGKRSDPGKEKAQTAIIDNSTAQEAILKAVVEGKTCAGGMDEAIQGCGATDMTYAGADVNSSSLKKNYASKDPATKIMDNSLNPEGYKAAQTMIQNATMYGAPPSLTVADAKKNPSYVAMYKPIITKLNAAHEALMEIVLARRAPTAVIPGVAGVNWTATSADYKDTFGIDAPKIPSFFELINFAVMREFSGPPKKEETKDPIKLAQALNAKMDLNNVLILQQWKATETTNILLANLLVNSVTPLNVDMVKAESNKTKIMK